MPTTNERLKQELTKPLMLETTDGKSIALHAEQLAGWIKKQADTDAGKLSTSSASLGHFGLKTAQDVIYFLRTPAGASTKGAIAKHLALVANIKEERRIEMLDNMLFKRRLIAFLILSVIATREAKSKTQNEQIAQQLDKLLHRKTYVSQAPSSSPYKQAEIDILKAYDAEMDYLNDEKMTYKSEKEKLKEDLAKEEELIRDMEDKHNLYNDALEDMDREFSDLEKHLDLTGESNPTPEQHELKQAAIRTLQEHLTTLQEKIEEQTESINGLLTEGNENDARKCLHRLNGFHFKAACINDLVAIAQGKKKLLDEEGQPVNSYSKAAFVLQPERKIVKHEGQYYLIGAEEDLHQMSPEQKAGAAKQYDQSKTELVSVKKMVLENMQVEQDHHAHQKNLLEERKSQIKEHKTLLNNQLTQVQAARAFAVNALANPQQLMQGPAPSLSSTPAHVAKAPAISAAQSFRKIIGFLREHEPEMTRQKLNQLCQGSKPAQEHLSKELAKIPASAPIPHTTMVSLLKNLERFGVDATKPSMTNIKSRTDHLADSDKKPSKSPTPLSMNPFKTQGGR